MSSGLPALYTALREAGPDDRVLDAFVLLGPSVLALLALLGRGPVTEVLAAGYVLALPTYVAAAAVRTARTTSD
ncbi:hypothetical protein [Halarchaeum nitratireducens]|uniref:Uncharacterized protein n=1 Tax=Halarchaeum nitratireducens TaxID=489913 RepID=A0A830GBH7_9EURY|nr:MULTISPECIES: hypothetical protein [Halarchaeum]MBP2252088.1 hypothetical protein [Halarchaeum solikamskense]GGN16844.1 hypothetical protein GCM10009021_16920 [Halarchaeum nitratireducens]